MANVLSRTDEALSPEEITSYLRKRVGDDAVLDTVVEYDTFTVVLTNAGYRAAAELCRDDALLAFDMFETTVGIDEREDGLSVVTILYSTTKGVRLLLKTLAEGGREAPVAPSLADLYPGANWSERETWDMFGIEFDGHPGLAPRILTVENFEGWPLRKDFYLGTREAKPWPGVKEPAELDEEGNVVERIPGPGDAPGPMALDKAMADQAKLANPSLADPEEPVTEPAPTEDADEADVASDSGAVLQSDKQRAEEAGEEAADSAKQRAEEQRVAAAEARARKAAERSEAVHVSTPEEDVPEVPKGTEASPEAGTQGGPPAQAPADDAGTVDVDGTEPGISTTEAGISETVERAREQGSVDYVGDDGPEAPVEPEGRESSAEGADEDAADATRPDDPPPSERVTEREDDA